jgi:putative ABC transport system permease protein
LAARNRSGLSEWSTIVGVVSDIASLHPHPEVVPEVYVPYWQWPMQNPTILVRTTGDPAAVAGAIRHETKAVIPHLPAPVIRTMDDLISVNVAQSRLQTVLLGLFAATAVGLAGVGLYGVLNYAVTQRTREIGVRMALGAHNRAVLSLVIGHGMRLAIGGVVLSLAFASALTRLLTGLLYGVQPADPMTFAAVSLLLVAIALLACWVPARRAARVHPMDALRSE